jgi:hypothetical protein
MSFELIQATQYNLTMSAAFHAGQVKSFAAKLSKGIEEMLNADDAADEWGTSCEVGDDGITLRISTPFGEARAIAVIQLIDGYIGARYIIEKVVASESGEPTFRQVWAVRITGDGKVTSDDGANVIYRANAISGQERYNGATAVALSAVYAIATDQGYYVAK